MWLDIDGSKFNTDHIAVVRPIDDDDECCVIFTVGQSATDQGFLVELPINEVFSMIQQARLHELAAMMENDSSTEETADPELEPEPD